MTDYLTNEKKIDLLVAEWKHLQDTTKWNFDIIEKQRNYGFIFIAAIFGITGSNLLTQQNQLWVLIPPIVIILLARITTQLEFINVRLDRILDIEHVIANLTGDPELLSTETKFASDFQSATVYVITYFYLYMFFYGVLLFSLVKAYIYLHEYAAYLSYPYVLMFSVTILFLVYRHVVYTINRYKKKQQIEERSNNCINSDS